MRENKKENKYISYFTYCCVNEKTIMSKVFFPLDNYMELFQNVYNFTSYFDNFVIMVI